MKKSTLGPVDGTEIANPEWNLNPILDILSYAGIDFIYVAELKENEFAIVHWADVEKQEDTDVTTDGKTLDEFLGSLYSRVMVIPATKEEILKVRLGQIAMRELYLSKKMYLVEGLDDCLKDVRVWENCSLEFLDQYLPDEGHKLTDK